MQTAIFAAGCFWGVESAFAAVPGVTATEVGYMGGTLASPTYEDVCSHRTGHAEVVRVTFDPEKVPYKTLVETFFAIHDPTQVNRQGPDVGDQYRSAIFTVSPEQAQIAQDVKSGLEQTGRHARPIATVIQPAEPFWRAEEYHQKYFARHGGGGCHV